MFFKLTIVNNASLCLNIRTDIMAMFCRFIFYCKQFFWSNDVMFALYRSSLQENKCRMQHIWKNTFVHFSFYRLIYIDCPNTIVMPGPHNSKRLPEGPWEDPLVTRWNEITFSWIRTHLKFMPLTQAIDLKEHVNICKQSIVSWNYILPSIGIHHQEPRPISTIAKTANDKNNANHELSTFTKSNDIFNYQQ